MQGQLPVVFAVCNEKREVEKGQIITELKEICNNELPEYAQPMQFYLLEELPLTSIGKINYRELEHMANE